MNHNYKATTMATTNKKKKKLHVLSCLKIMIMAIVICFFLYTKQILRFHHHNNNAGRKDNYNAVVDDATSMFLQQQQQQGKKRVGQQQQQGMMKDHQLSSNSNSNTKSNNNNKAKNVARKTADVQRIQLVKATDSIYSNENESPIVVEKYKLVFFIMPKVASTYFKLLFHELDDIDTTYLGKPQANKNWDMLHHPHDNHLKYLRDYSINEANYMMTSKEWTKAIFVRNPHERLLSVYLDKGLAGNFWLVRRKCCKRMRDCMGNPDNNYYEKHSLGHFVQFLSKAECFHTNNHFSPQSERFSNNEQIWHYIDYVGHMETLDDDVRKLMQLIGANPKSLLKMNKKQQQQQQDNAIGGGQHHATGSHDRMKKYYTSNKLIEDVTRLYKKDYENPYLKLQVPTLVV